MIDVPEESELGPGYPFSTDTSRRLKRRNVLQRIMNASMEHEAVSGYWEIVDIVIIKGLPLHRPCSRSPLS